MVAFYMRLFYCQDTNYIKNVDAFLINRNQMEDKTHLKQEQQQKLRTMKWSMKIQSFQMNKLYFSARYRSGKTIKKRKTRMLYSFWFFNAIVVCPIRMDLFVCLCSCYSSSAGPSTFALMAQVPFYL